MSTKEPPCLAFRARGMEGVNRGNTPPSRVSSKGGDGGRVSTENPSISRFKRGRGWRGGSTDNPSVSRFERGRGWRVCRRRTPLSRNLSEGGVGDAGYVSTNPLSGLSSKGEGWRVSTEETPLRLVFLVLLKFSSVQFSHLFWRTKNRTESSGLEPNRVELVLPVQFQFSSRFELTNRISNEFMYGNIL